MVSYNIQPNGGAVSGGAAGPVLKFSTFKNGSYSDGEVIPNEGTAGSDGDAIVRGSGATSDGTTLTLPEGVYLDVSNPVNYLRFSTEPFTVLARLKGTFGRARVSWYCKADNSPGNNNSQQCNTIGYLFDIYGSDGKVIQTDAPTGFLHIEFTNLAWRYDGSVDSSGQSVWRNGEELTKRGTTDTFDSEVDKTPSNPIARIGKRNQDQDQGTYEIQKWELWFEAVPDDYIISGF